MSGERRYDWHDSQCGGMETTDLAGAPLTLPCDCGFPDLFRSVFEDGRRETLDAAWAEAEAALPMVGWVDPVGSKWVIPSGTWSIDIRRVESGDGYFEPAVEGYWATAKVEANPRPFAIRGDLGSTPADALRSLAKALQP